MDNGSKPLNKFTNLCRKVMWLKSSSADGMPKPLFDAIVPVGAEPQQGSAIVTYQTDNAKAASLVCKNASLCDRVVLWILKYRFKMVQKLMESFDLDAGLLVPFSKFNLVTLIVLTTFGEVNELEASKPTWESIKAGMQTLKRMLAPELMFSATKRHSQ
jgi:hypothetical protein